MRIQNYIKGNSSLKEEIEILRKPEEFEKVRDLWMGLQWNPYYDIDWLLFKYEQPWCKETPYVFLIKQNGCSKAIVAGEIKFLPIQFQIGYKRWQGPSLKTLFINRYGVLGENDESLWSILEPYFEDILIKGEVEAVLLRDFDLNSAVHKLKFSTLPAPCKYKTNIIQEHWFIDSNRLIEHKRNHKDFWKNVKKRGNKIYFRWREIPNIIKNCGNDLELNSFINYTEQISKNTWQRKFSGINFAADDVKKRYKHFLERGLLNLYVLFLKEKPLSFLHGIKYYKKFYAEVMGYDYNYKEEGLGTYFTGKVIEELINSGISFFDWGVGNSEAKRRFCDSFLTVKDCFLVAPKLKFMALNTLRVIFLSIHISSKKMLANIGLYHKIRSAWRYGLRKIS